jgi:hypothetical protein
MSYSNYYPVFENNQVLTSSQLNDLVTYLDEQNRATRTKLIGIGVLCGLEPSVNVTYTNSSSASFTIIDLDASTAASLNPASIASISDLTITLSEGKGVTSEGYIISLGEMEFTQYREYFLPPGVTYAPFMKGDGSQVQLWEVLPESYTPQIGEPALFQLDQAPVDFIVTATGNDVKVMLLYLECIDVDLKSCLGKSCDDLGIKRTFTLRKLLISLEDLQTIKANTYNFDTNFSGKFDLPDLRAKRVLFDPTELGSRDYYAFSEKYTNAIVELYPGTTTSRSVLQVLNDTYLIFESILSPVYGNSNPFDTTTLSSIQAAWTSIINKSSIDGPSYLGVQYFYDFIKDLLLAYDEFRTASFELMSQCCPPIGLFPKHLLLGEVVRENSLRQSANRNDFISAPVTMDQRLIEERLVMLHERIVMMIRNFQSARVHNPSVVNPLQIRITPSCEKKEPLSSRAIPYYYDINTDDTSLKLDLERVWNFENLRRAKQVGGETPVLAYENQVTDQSNPIDPIATPLLYDIDAQNFYRIEGHLRLPVATVKSSIESLRDRFDLPFEVVTLRLNGLATETEMEELCKFPDLSSQYVAYRNAEDAYLKRVHERGQSLLNEVNGTTTNDFIEYLFAEIGRVTKSSSSVLFQPRGLSKGGKIFTTQSSSSDAQESSSNSTINSQLRFSPATSSTSAIGASNNAVGVGISVIPISALTDVQLQLPLQAPYSIAKIKAEMAANLNLLKTSLEGAIAKLPQNLNDFEYGTISSGVNLSFIQQYVNAQSAAAQTKAWFNRFLDEVVHGFGMRFNQEFYFQLSMWANDHLSVLNDFVMNTSFKMLEAVAFEHKYRINYLIANDPRLFSNFIKTNPGLDHKAGVAPGGTFVLLHNGTPLSSALTPRSAVANAAINLQEIHNLQVRRASIESSPIRTATEINELAIINDTLCKAFEAQAEQSKNDVLTPIDFGAETVSTGLLNRIDLPGNAVIADFCLPYLSTCDCMCTDIPTPTQAQLNMPAIALTAYVEYNPGDYAFAEDTINSTYGSPAVEVIIRVNSFITHNTEGNVRLFYVSNGLSQSSANYITAKGGTVVRVRPASTEDDYFKYKPAANFIGVDTFEYYFEVWNDQNILMARSNKAKAVVVVGRAPQVVQPVINGNTTFEQTIEFSNPSA